MENIFTANHLFTLIDDIQEAESASYEVEVGLLSKRLGGKVSKSFQETLVKLEEAGSLPAFREEESDYFRELKDYLLKLPRVKIELAFAPSEKFVKKISDFINQGYSQKIILDISVKPAILAGAKIEYNGKFKDYSYTDKLQKVINDKYGKALVQGTQDEHI